MNYGRGTEVIANAKLISLHEDLGARLDELRRQTNALATLLNQRRAEQLTGEATGDAGS